MTVRPVMAVLLLAAAPVLAQVPAPAPSPAPRQLPVVAAVRPCAGLATVDLTAIGGDGSRVVSAAEHDRDGIATCVVEGTMAPSIAFTALLPVRTWSQRYLQTGCGGLCGRISLQVAAADGCAAVAQGGFAMASTDMGHSGTGGDFGRDPQKRVDFAYRAVHVTAVAAKQLIREYYGRDALYRYFTGCSDGGREALMEAQRYPDDFNGIVAGAPAMNFQVQNGLFHAWQARSNTGPDGKPILVASRLPILHVAVLEQCDRLDGQADGLIADPRRCRVDLEPVTCRTAAAEACLTAAEAEVARRFYDGPRDAATRVRLTPGGPQPGSELAWAGVFVPASASEPIFSERITLDALKHLSFETNPPGTFGLADVTFDRAWLDRLRPLHPLYDATNPDLSRFAAAGGKLILWHGWSDPHISPMNTIAYHEAIGRLAGPAQRDSFERLYLLSGVYHCGGGEGPSRIDMLTPMMAWVERGIAPREIVARTAPRGPSSGVGQPGTPPGDGPSANAGPPAAAAPAGGARPVYPYPFVAKWDGKGDPAQPSSYVRGNPAVFTPPPPWAGSDLFRPYTPRER